MLLGWTLRGSIQAYIDVYVSQATFTEVERSFPYMVAREFASGGGDVRGSQCSRRHPLTLRTQIPEFKWHIFEDKVPIDVADSGILITPFEGGTVTFYPASELSIDTEYSTAWASVGCQYTTCVCPHTGHIAVGDACAAFHAENQPLVFSGTTSGADRTAKSCTGKCQRCSQPRPGRARTPSVPEPCIQNSGFCYIHVRRVMDLRRFMGGVKPTFRQRSLAPICCRHRGLPATGSAYLTLWYQRGRQRRKEDKCAAYILDRLWTRGVT